MFTDIGNVPQQECSREQRINVIRDVPGNVAVLDVIIPIVEPNLKERLAREACHVHVRTREFRIISSRRIMVYVSRLVVR